MGRPVSSTRHRDATRCHGAEQISVRNNRLAWLARRLSPAGAHALEAVFAGCCRNRVASGCSPLFHVLQCRPYPPDVTDDPGSGGWRDREAVEHRGHRGTARGLRNAIRRRTCSRRRTRELARHESFSGRFAPLKDRLRHPRRYRDRRHSGHNRSRSRAEDSGTIAFPFFKLTHDRISSHVSFVASVPQQRPNAVIARERVHRGPWPAVHTCTSTGRQ